MCVLNKNSCSDKSMIIVLFTSFPVLHSPVKSTLKGRLPLLLFSHGLGGVPEIYTSVLQEVVSHGFVVLAVNHADGSACFSSHINADGSVGCWKR